MIVIIEALLLKNIVVSKHFDLKYELFLLMLGNKISQTFHLHLSIKYLKHLIAIYR